MLLQRDMKLVSCDRIFLSRDKSVDSTGVLSCRSTLFVCLRHNHLSLRQVSMMWRHKPDILLFSWDWRSINQLIDDYAKDGGPGELWLLCSFYHGSLRTWIKTIVNRFAISNHTAMILAVHALRSYLKLICKYEVHGLPNKKDSDAKDHGKNYIKIRPPSFA